MSKEALAKVVQRAISDGAFRRQLSSNPGAALQGFDLSSDEFAAIKSGDSGRLSALGVDLRMSKAFTLSSDHATGDAVAKSVSNDLGASYTGAVTTGGQGSAGSSALISGDASDNDAMISSGDGLGREGAIIGGEPAHALGATYSGDDTAFDPGLTGNDSAFNAALTGGEGANASNTLTGGDGANADNVLTPGDETSDGILVVDDEGISGASNPGEAVDGPSIQD